MALSSEHAVECFRLGVFRGKFDDGESGFGQFVEQADFIRRVDADVSGIPEGGDVLEGNGLGLDKHALHGGTEGVSSWEAPEDSSSTVIEHDEYSPPGVELRKQERSIGIVKDGQVAHDGPAFFHAGRVAKEGGHFAVNSVCPAVGPDIGGWDAVLGVGVPEPDGVGVAQENGIGQAGILGNGTDEGGFRGLAGIDGLFDEGFAFPGFAKQVHAVTGGIDVSQRLDDGINVAADDG